MLYALIEGYNAFKREITQELTTMPHADITSKTSGYFTDASHTAAIVTNADATVLAGVLLIANELKVLIPIHFADDIAHSEADETNAVASADASDQDTANTLLNEIKDVLNAHFIETDVHFTNDGTNTIGTADATDLASSVTLANALKTAFNAHVQFGLTSPSVKVVEA